MSGITSWLIAFAFINVVLANKYSKLLLDKVEGTVSGENFTYYSLTYPGNIVLVLNTLKGDADIYISESLQHPTYEPDKYDLHSATCGVDAIRIPRSFNRPVGVGIYGHTSYENSTFKLEVYYNPVSEMSPQYDDLKNRHEKISNPISRKNKSAEDRKMMSKLKTILGRTGLWVFLEVFDLFFL